MQLKAILTDEAADSVCHFWEVFLDPAGHVSCPFPWCPRLPAITVTTALDFHHAITQSF